jgi:hypothetical protein
MSLVGCTLEIGAIFIVDSLKFPLISDEFDSLEDVCVISSGTCTAATCAFYTSRLSVEVLISKLGQADGFCNCHCGPFHHSADDERAASSVPCDIKLAGLD